MANGGDPHQPIVSTVAYIIIINGNISFKTNPNPKLGRDVMTYIRR